MKRRRPLPPFLKIWTDKRGCAPQELFQFLKQQGYAWVPFQGNMILAG
jgi:hypothetical protein